MAGQLHITADFRTRPRVIPKDAQHAYSLLKDELDSHKEQCKQLVKEVVRGSQIASQTASATAIAQGASSGGSIVNTITSIVQALSANVATTIIFTASSEFVAWPTCWALSDGVYGPVGFTPDYSGLPNSFRVTAISNCTLYAAYKPL